MVAHCLADDWRAFLDPANYTEEHGGGGVAAAAAGAEPEGGSEGRSVAGHRVYSPMVGKPKIFLHRSPLVPAEYAYYQRCV
jgi:hypothetical protein